MFYNKIKSCLPFGYNEIFNQQVCLKLVHCINNRELIKTNNNMYKILYYLESAWNLMSFTLE